MFYFQQFVPVICENNVGIKQLLSCSDFATTKHAASAGLSQYDTSRQSSLPKGLAKFSRLDGTWYSHASTIKHPVVSWKVVTELYPKQRSTEKNTGLTNIAISREKKCWGTFFASLEAPGYVYIYMYIYMYIYVYIYIYCQTLLVCWKPWGAFWNMLPGLEAPHLSVILSQTEEGGLRSLCYGR